VRPTLIMLACGLTLVLSGCGSPYEVDSTRAREAAPSPPPQSRGAAESPSSDRPLFSPAGWKTDFTRHSVPLSEISSGGPPRDGIPPIDAPQFVSSTEADGWLKDREPVVVFVLDGEARAYPLQILVWHEIVNDVVAGIPVVITFCPLCNTAIAFDRRVAGYGDLRFGTTGNLRYSDLVMWDDKTESWWQQITGEAIVGTLTGTRLKMLPASITSYAEFKAAYPRGVVLSRDTGHSRPYGANPYVGYDDINDRPFLFRGQVDPRLRPMERVVTVELNGEAVAYPFSLLKQRRLVTDVVGGQPIVVFWTGGTASALDQGTIAQSRDVGSAGVFLPTVDGPPLTFEVRGDEIYDRETGSRWSVLGRALEGPLAGQELQPVVHGNHFWFAWVVFKPHTRVLQ
jgi:hypothetical protein